MNKEMENATVRELTDWPGVTWTEENGGKHGKLILSYRGETRMIVVAHTPSDQRAVPNHLAAIRRELRALGAEKKHAPPPKAAKATPPVMEQLKEAVLPKSTNKIELIFSQIGELRYSEMLELAGYLRDVATEKNLQRGRPQSWATMLQAAVEGSQSPSP